MSTEGNINNAILLEHSEPLFLYDKGEIRYEGKGIEELKRMRDIYKNKLDMLELIFSL